jgi:hypothetical protein
MPEHKQKDFYMIHKEQQMKDRNKALDLAVIKERMKRENAKEDERIMKERELKIRGLCKK